jgi:DNA-binding CsgD family transcriptional regulator
MATFLTFVLFPLVLIVAVILWATESRQQRIRRWVAAGISQREAARRLGISRYQVSKALAMGLHG